MLTSEGTRDLNRGLMDRSTVKKDLLQRNAAEATAYHRLSRHLEYQRRAFVRQNTRDEDEVRLLLQRLQTQQPTSLTSDDVSEGFDSEGDDLNLEHLDPKDRITSNPYPVTIVPKFGPRHRVNVAQSGSFKSPGCRRKSVEFEDVQEALTSLSLRSTSNHDHTYKNEARDDFFSSPLASPDAISSVRRMRKSVTELANRRTQLRTSGLLNSGDSNKSCSPGLHRRSNSLKDKTRNQGEISPRTSIKSRRGGSLKEKRPAIQDSPRQLSRSYSVLTKTTFYELSRQQDVPKSNGQGYGSKFESDSKTEFTSQLEAKGSFRINASEGSTQACRRGQKKLPVSRKTSSESVNSGDDRSPRRVKCVQRKKRTSLSSSPDTTPNVSPIAKDQRVFTY